MENFKLHACSAAFIIHLLLSSLLSHAAPWPRETCASSGAGAEGMLWTFLLLHLRKLPIKYLI